MGHPLDAATAFDFAFDAIDGGPPIDLRAHRGSALLVVNVASACGYTPQYRDLEALHQAKAAKGLLVIGAPCNDFGAQEPAPDAAIKAFCAGTYDVTFPLTAKLEIVAPLRRHPFYAWIAHQLGSDALPKWNFHKYLIDRNGHLSGAFPPSAGPLGQEILSAVQKALAPTPAAA